MRRRDFITLLGGAAAPWPLTARAQQAALPLVGVLWPTFNVPARALRAGLKEGGYVEGTNLAIAERSAEGRMERFEALAAELAALGPKAIVSANTEAVLAIHKVAPTIPLVSAGIGDDPVALGLAASIPRPGGAFTGLLLNASGGETAIAGKRIGLLHELVPGLKRLGIIGEAGPVFDQTMSGVQAAGERLGIAVVALPVRTMADVETAFLSGAGGGADGFYVFGSPLLLAQRTKVAEIAVRAGKPTVGALGFQAEAGLLMTYAIDPADSWRRAGGKAAKILSGTKPSDLPIEMADKFTFTINLKTARTLGIEVGPKLLLLADEVIE
jgi:putative ABC transport system substrate-binding protein